MTAALPGPHGDEPCPRCGAYCRDRIDCDLALDGVDPADWSNPLAERSTR